MIKSEEVFILCIVVGCFLSTVQGHGMLLDPVGRASRWRFDSTALKNYDDNAMYCGGFYQHWTVNGGKCGVCGDEYSLPTPRPNELGGTFGSGVIVKTYQPDTIIPVGVQITASHMGYFYFELCNVITAGSESENCFETLTLGNGDQNYPITSFSSAYYSTSVRLPTGLSCNHCVLRWTYVAGNNWGICSNGVGALGCGPQETFKSCSDIRISYANAAAETDNDVLDNIPEDILTTD